MGLRKVRLQFQSLPKARDGLVELFLSLQGQAEVEMSDGIVGLQCQRLAEATCGLVEFFLRQPDSAQVVVSQVIGWSELNGPLKRVGRLVELPLILKRRTQV